MRMKKSLLTVILVITCILMLSTSAFALTNYTYLTYPSYTTTPSHPWTAAMTDDSHMNVCFAFAGTCPTLYDVYISEVDSAGNNISGFYYFSGVFYPTPSSPPYSNGGGALNVPTTNMVKGHIYRVGIASDYPGQPEFFSEGYIKY